MDSTNFSRKPAQSTRFPFGCATEACRHFLRTSQTLAGRFVPLTVTDIVAKIGGEGFRISERDAEALLRELALNGEAVEIDALAGFRWNQPAA
jgi:hypothetical protein